ncbi:heterokaryon incompatibility protein-domain-containing protein, partial [Immersiella caudata]
YVALSYVWGAAAGHGLTSSLGNIDNLQRPGNLWLLQRELPAVITDAMSLVFGIGERYLWVDRLCIVQDDGEAKMTAIRQMDVIYENAVMTIVAAEGDGAGAGLPGVVKRTRTQPQLCEVIGPRLRMIVPRQLNALRRTKWASRAWTFQEHLASPRCLIFANRQVIFKCSWDAPFREDIASEYQFFRYSRLRVPLERHHA